jgi:hypothetical protein
LPWHVYSSFVRSCRFPSYVEVPAEALRFKGEKAFVGIVSPEKTVTFRPVTLTESNGIVARFSSGLRAGERVILHPGESIGDGEMVQPIESHSK